MCSINSSFNWPTLIIAIIGAAAWLQPIILSWLKRPKLYLKILSNYGEISAIPDCNSLQTIILQKISIYAKNVDFSIKDIKIFIKFPDQENEIITKLWAWRDLEFHLPENGQIVKKKLKINSNDYIIHKLLFPKDTYTVGYISFSVDYTNDIMFEYLRFEFVNFENKTITKTIIGDDIHANLLIHDKEIWVNID